MNGKTLTVTGVTSPYSGARTAAITVGASSSTSVKVTFEGGGTIKMKGLTAGCYGMTTTPYAECHVEKDVYFLADLENKAGSSEYRIICANTNSTIYFKDAKVEAINTVSSTKIALIVAWSGEIFIDGGEYIWGNPHYDWSGALDSVNNITIYDGKFNGRIWYSGNGEYKIYGGEFSQANIYTQSGSTVISKPWNEYILDAVVTDLGAGNVYRYKITVPKCTFQTEVNSESAGSASANPSSGRTGDKITITAKPKDGFKFVNWSVDGSGSTNPITRTIQSGDIDKTYTYKANFALAGTPSPTASNIKDTSMTVSWGAVTGATSYDLYISTDSSCSSSFVSGYGPKSLTATSASLTGLNINSKYYYKVVAKAPDNLSTTSSVGNATTLKADSTVTVAPKAKNLVYSGTAMQLIEAGSAEGGTLKYSLDGSTYSTDIPTGVNADGYNVYYKVFGDANHNDTQPQTLSVTIAKADCTVTAPEVVDNLVYTGSPLGLVTEGSAVGGEMKYSLDGSTYSTNIPTGVNAGNHTVYYKVFGDPNHNDTQAQTLSVTIAKADCTVTAPEVVDNLVYTGSPLGLITGGSAVGGEMKYSLDGSTYSTNIPTGVNAGDYTVYYKVFGDSNHNDTQAQTLSGTIAKADCTVTAPEVIDNLVYTGSPIELISAGSAVGGEMRYVVNDGSYTQTIPTGILAGDYTVNYVVVGDSNHNSTQPLATPLTVRIDKAARSPISTIAQSYTYDQTEPVVMPSVDVEPEEDAVVTYFYNTQNSKVGGTKWENVTATTLDAGTYYAYATAAETDNYYSFTTEPTEFTVNKGECAIIAPQAKSLEYMDEPIELVTAGSVKGGTLVYSIDNVEYSKDIPKATKVAEYTVYYKAIGDKNHNDSEVYSLNVSIGKGQRKDVLATVESYKYRQTEPLPTPGLTPKLKDSPKITYYYNTVQSNCDGTPWSELTAMTLKAGTYYIYAEIEATDSYQKYVTKPNEFVVLNCDKILITEEDVKVFIDGKDKVTEEIIDKYGYELHETKKDESGKVVTPGDFEKKITKVDNGDTIDYIIEYTFSGDYTGKVVKKITIAKQKDDPSDKSNDVIRSMVSKEKAAEYAPVVESMPKTAVKSLIVKDILDNKEIVEKQLSKTQFTTKDIVKHLEEAKLDKISVISNVVIEVKEEKSSEVVPDDKEKIVKVAKELGAADKIGYLDISMFISYSVVNEKNQEILKMTHKKITDTQAKDLKEKFESTITIVVPPQMRLVPEGYEREYSVVRVHDGKAEVLAKSTEGKLTFQTSKFSTYALLYKDTQLPPKQDEPSGDDTQSVETQNFFSIPVENVSNIVTLNGFISPKTGDSNALFGWAVLLLVGIALVLTGKKKDNGR